jgi:hypothetical protein
LLQQFLLQVCRPCSYYFFPAEADQPFDTEGDLTIGTNLGRYLKSSTSDTAASTSTAGVTLQRSLQISYPLSLSV